MLKKSIYAILSLSAAVVMLLMFTTIALAATGQADDPISLILRFHEYIRTGRGTMAIGVSSIFFVWILRNVLGRWMPWFKTQAGGWTLSFLVAGLNYFGSGVLADQPLELALILNAVGAAFVSSGGWEGFSDMIKSFKKSTIVAASSVGILLAILPGCAGQVKEVVTAVGPAIVDCTTANRDKIDALLTEFKPILLEGSVDWSSVYSRAKDAGKAIGGCFMGELLQAYLKIEPVEPQIRSLLPQSNAEDQKIEARAYFELYRKNELDGAQLKTSDGSI